MADQTNQAGPLAEMLLRRTSRSSRRSLASEELLSGSCLSAVLEGLLEPVWIADKEGRVLWSNHVARTLPCASSIPRFGCEVPDSVGMSRLPGLWRNGEDHEDILVGSRWYQMSVSPLFNSFRKVVGALHLMRDITERKAAEDALREHNKALERRMAEAAAKLERVQRSLGESEANLRRFVENAPVAIAMFDREMTYLAASRRWLFDYSLKKNVLGQAYYRLSPELSEHWRRALQRALAGEVFCAEEDRMRARAQVIGARFGVRPRKSGGTTIHCEIPNGSLPKPSKPRTHPTARLWRYRFAGGHV